MASFNSIWDDHAVNMLWLDSEAYPADADPSTPGVSRGPCAVTSGVPKGKLFFISLRAEKISNVSYRC